MTILERMRRLFGPKPKPVRLHEWSTHELRKDPHTGLLVLGESVAPHCLACGITRSDGERYTLPCCPGSLEARAWRSRT